MAGSFPEEDDLFGAFDEPSHKLKRQKHSASSSCAQHTTDAAPSPSPPAPAATDKPLPGLGVSTIAEGTRLKATALPFAFMEAECLVSTCRLSDGDRQDLERLIRQMRVPADGEQRPPPPASTYYCKSYCVDYAGASSAASAASWPTPIYEQYVRPVLPASASRPPAAAPTPAKKEVRRQRSGPQLQQRYFEAPADASAARAGQLSAGLRDILGIGELDPPPYLSRMQNLGYPPGYLVSALHRGKDGTDALQFFTEPPGSKAAKAAACTDSAPSVDFPGLNVPPPAGADSRRWNWQKPITEVAKVWR